MKEHINHRILAIDPTTQGFGFAIIEDPPNLIDWGVAGCKKRNVDCLKRIEMMIEDYQPTVIVLEDCSRKDSRRCHAVGIFIRKILKLAGKRKIEIHTFSWEEVQKTFSKVGATTKQEIATKIASQFPELIPRLPRRREPWMSEDHRMNIFDAVALAVTFVDFERNL